MEWNKTGPRFKPHKADVPGPGVRVQLLCCCLVYATSNCLEIPKNTQPSIKRLYYSAGAYDPKLVQGWKADPKSAFVGDERFKNVSQEISEGGPQLGDTPFTACMHYLEFVDVHLSR